MTVLLHGVEALPGSARYAVHFRRPDGLEHSAVVHVSATGITVAEASLPDGWKVGAAEYIAMAEVVEALHAARSLAPTIATLTDVDGGWDVSLGNVVLVDGTPACTAHGALAHGPDDVWECAVCAARARYVG